MSKNRRDGLARLALVAALIVGAASWLEFLWAPFERYSATRDFWTVVIELFKFQSVIYPAAPMLGYLFILTTITLGLAVITAARAISDYIIFSRTGVSILETDLKLEFPDNGWKSCRLVRKQLLHANRSDVVAYHFDHKADHGSINRASLLVSSHIGPRKVTKEIMSLERAPNKSLDVTEVFKEPLPTNPLATYLPNSWVLALYRLGLAFRGIVVERNTCIEYVDEYLTSEPMFQLTSVRYPVTNVKITLEFLPDAAPLADTVMCHVIKDNLIQTLEPKLKSEDGRLKFVFEVGRLYQERARVTWRPRQAAPGPSIGASL